MPLKRVIGLKEALAINIGAIIGAGIFVLSGIASGIAGPATIAAIAIGAAIATLTGLSFAQLSHAYPLEGGSYEYARRIYGGFVGLIIGLMLIISFIVSAALVALSFGGYFTSLFGNAVSAPLVAAALVALLGIVNYLGVKGTARMSLILTLVKVVILAFFIIVGIFFIHGQNYRPFMPGGYSSVFTAAAFIFFAYTGFARVTMVGEEVREPRKTIPRAIIYSILLSAVIYALVILVLVGMVPYGSIADSASPLAYAMLTATRNPLFGYIVSIGALFATVNVVLAMVLGVSRIGFAMARDGNLPRQLAHLNGRGVPDVALIIPTLLMMGVVFVNFREVASLSNVAALVGYSVVNVAAIKFTLSRAKRGNMLFKSRAFALVPLLGTVSAIALVFFLTAASLYIMAVLLIGIVIAAVAYRKIKHEPIGITALLKPMLKH